MNSEWLLGWQVIGDKMHAQVSQIIEQQIITDLQKGAHSYAHDSFYLVTRTLQVKRSVTCNYCRERICF